MRIFLLDGKDMTSRETAYRNIERNMEFPDWFGHNLDALADCLSELEPDTAVIFVNTDALQENLGNYANKVLATFRDISEEFGFRFIEKG